MTLADAPRDEFIVVWRGPPYMPFTAFWSSTHNSWLDTVVFQPVHDCDPLHWAVMPRIPGVEKMLDDNP